MVSGTNASVEFVYRLTNAGRRVHWKRAIHGTEPKLQVRRHDHVSVYMRLRSNEVLAYLRRRTVWLGIAAAAFASIGMAGYVGGRMTADYW